MSPKVLISFVCFVSASLLHAQYDNLLRDPDITWVAEYTADFVMNPENNADTFDYNFLHTIQFQKVVAETGLYGKGDALKYLSEQAILRMYEENFQAFKDSSFSSRMTRHDLFKYDTVINCFPEEGEELCFIVERTVDYEDIKSFRIRQVYWYTRKTHSFNARLLAYAPVTNIRNSEGDIIGKCPLYWLKADESPPKRFKNKQFNYIFQTQMRGNAPRPEDFKVLKGSFDFRKFFETEIETPSWRCLDRYDYTPADMSDLRAECFGTDTIVTFSPETYEEQVQTKQRNCIEQIEKIRFVQNWYYDERHNRLYARLVGVAPLAAIRDNEGEFRFYKPLFYQMYR